MVTMLCLDRTAVGGAGSASALKVARTAASEGRWLVDRDTAFQRRRVRDQILNCHRCPLRVTCTKPTPFTGPTPAELVVIGEAPGMEEDRDGRPFVGASGRFIRGLLSDYRIDPGAAFTMNSVSCRPPGNRSPKISELEACRGNYDAQLRVAEARFVLLLGATALSTVRPDLKVTQIHGRPFVPAIRGKQALPNPYERLPVYLPTYHPAAALRDVDVKARLRADIALFAEVLKTPDYLGLWPTSCVRCGGEGAKQPLDLLAYCHTHMPTTRNPKLPAPPGTKPMQESFGPAGSAA